MRFNSTNHTVATVYCGLWETWSAAGDDGVEHAEPGHGGQQQGQGADEADQGQDEQIVGVDADRVVAAERGAQRARVCRRAGARAQRDVVGGRSQAAVGAGERLPVGEHGEPAVAGVEDLADDPHGDVLAAEVDGDGVADLRSGNGKEVGGYVNLAWPLNQRPLNMS